jgi:hypothetical protein
VSGTLGGRRFSIAVVKGRLASAGSGWPTLAQLGALLGHSRLAGGTPRLR